MSWNYRVIRTKHIVDDKSETKRFWYTYAIHEVYYDKNHKAIMVSAEPQEPFGENILELRSSWVMMGEAFGQPILNYTDIPEEGYDKNNPLVIDINLEDCIAEKDDTNEEDQKEFDDFINDFDPIAYRNEQEQVRIDEDKKHNDKFLNVHPFEALFKLLIDEYRENKEQKETNAIH